MFCSDGGSASKQLAIRVARSLSPTSNAIFQRVAGAVVGISNRLRPRSPTRALCRISGGAVGGGACGVPNDVLSALLRLAAMPAFAEVPESETKGTDTKSDSDTSKGRPVRYPAPDRIVAIGDVHGDYEALRKLLRRAGLVGRSGEWTGGRSVLVQVGDQLDRGDGERDIYKMLFRLQDTAPKDGGAVHILLGNHEMMNINLDFRYVTAGGFADFVRPHEGGGGARAVTKPFRELIKALPPPMRPRAAALAPGGKLARELAERTQVAVMVGDTVFVHAGLQPAHLGKDGERALGSLNAQTRAFLRGERARLPEMLEGAGGPLWMRTYSHRGVRTGGQECQLLGQTLKLLGAKRMVVGHTVQPAINAACGGRVWRVDVGISAAYGGTAEALEILPGGRTQVVTPGGTVDGRMRTF